MARKPRLVFANAMYHITFRGNERRDIFCDDKDRERFLLSLAERVPTYQVRVYLYVLMPNHVHLLLETPLPNVSAFLGSLLTSYAAYFNLRHRRSGHLTQNRYHSSLVEANDYLLRLSRYIHLNPVFAKPLTAETLNNRILYLSNYRWSSYQGYVGVSEADKFMDYGPILATMPGRNKKDQQVKYQKYIEAGIAVTDDEFQALIRKSPLGIGSEEFIKEVQERYRHGAVHIKTEDVAFRKHLHAVSPDEIIQTVCRAYRIKTEELQKHRLNDWIKPVTAALLTQAGGLSQREVATSLGLTTGAAVSLQLKRLRNYAPPEHQNIFKKLMREFNI